MEWVDKKGQVILTNPITVSHDVFLTIIKRFTHIRVAVAGGKGAFPYTYFKVSKKEVIDVVRMQQMKVTYSITYNSKVQPKLKDVLFIQKLRMTFD